MHRFRALNAGFPLVFALAALGAGCAAHQTAADAADAAPAWLAAGGLPPGPPADPADGHWRFISWRVARAPSTLCGDDLPAAAAAQDG